MFLMLSSLIDSANLFADKAVESIADFNTVLLSANSLSFFPVSSPEDAKSKSSDVKDESTLMESHASEKVRLESCMAFVSVRSSLRASVNVVISVVWSYPLCASFSNSSDDTLYSLANLSIS